VDRAEREHPAAAESGLQSEPAPFEIDVTWSRVSYLIKPGRARAITIMRKPQIATPAKLLRVDARLPSRQAALNPSLGGIQICDAPVIQCDNRPGGERQETGE